MNDASKLQDALARALNVGLEPIVIPTAMEAELDALAKMLKSAGGGRPPVDRIRQSLAYFRAHGDLPDLATARAVCFGAGEKYEDSESRLIEEADRFPRLLDRVDEYRPEPRSYRRCFRGLLHTYFNYDGGHSRCIEVGKRNWSRLRDYLHDRRAAIMLEGAQPEWAEFIALHPNLLTIDPVNRYASELLQGRKQIVDELRSRLDVNDSHWLMRKLVIAQIEAATRKSDQEFKNLVSPILTLLDGHEGLEDEGLKHILNRYARLRGPTLHPALRDRAVKCWGNPWLDRNAAKWALAEPEARALVTGWFKLHVIRTFFEQLSDDRNTDPRRVKFWERYYEQIDDMYFALGSTHRYSSNADVKQMRKDMGDRLLGLKNAGAPSNNAFIMMMGDLVAVEFGVSGNACYLFKRDQLPFELVGTVDGNTSHEGLKSPNHLVKLPHIDRSFKKWEEDFADSLNRRRVRLSTRPEFPTAERSQASSGAATFNASRMRELCTSHSIEWIDKSEKGGNIAVMWPSQAGEVAEQLMAWGFAFSPQKCFWWRKGWL